MRKLYFTSLAIINTFFILSMQTIFASGVRVSSPLEQLNLDNNFKKPNFCDIIGSILYDQDLFKIDFLANQSKNSKKRGISGFFSWLDQYI